ncbi:hypothetical protein OS189_11770 [Sulfitobacter sp. F26169L]|nr:hypothetical protein [Sulfitobacter sp. F26169L]MCX7567020.1 hypothetical protein [Sulfitobacter sp. F26169L]
MAGYTAAYMLLHPQALIDGSLAGPGFSQAGNAFFQKHHKLTHPVFAAL